MSTSRRLILNVQHWDGQCHQLVGRPAFIAAFIAANAERIMNSPRGNLTFNWDGPALRPALHEDFPHINTEGKWWSDSTTR